MSSSTKQAVVLPTVTLTIPPPVSLKNPALRPLFDPVNLKIRITPHALVTSPPFTAGAFGRKIEECVDVVVEIGGKVDVGLEVEEDMMEWAGDDTWEVEQVIRDRVKALFAANTSSIASTIAAIPSTDITASFEDAASSESSTHRHHRSPLFRLSPLIANPSHSHSIKILTTTGRPQANLTRLDIKLEWVRPRSRVDKDDEDEEKEGEEDESQESTGADETHAWDEDEFCDHKVDDEGLDDEDMLPEFEEEVGGGAGDGVALPKWVEVQLKQGIHKVIRTHLIKRFPLLFDAVLIEHATSLALHRSLTSSLTHFLTLSSSHATTLLKPARHLLRSIAQEQEKFLVLNVDAASAIKGTPVSKLDVGKKNKRRKTQQDEENEGESNLLTTAKGRAHLYMVQVHAKVMEEDRGPRADERRVGRLVGEAMGRVGRERWELGRRGIGRMAAFRVPLKDIEICHDDIDILPAAPPVRKSSPTDEDAVQSELDTSIDPDTFDTFDQSFDTFDQSTFDQDIHESQLDGAAILGLDDWDDFDDSYLDFDPQYSIINSPHSPQRPLAHDHEDLLLDVLLDDEEGEMVYDMIDEDRPASAPPESESPPMVDDGSGDPCPDAFAQEAMIIDEHYESVLEGGDTGGEYSMAVYGADQVSNMMMEDDETSSTTKELEFDLDVTSTTQDLEFDLDVPHTISTTHFSPSDQDLPHLT